MKFSRRVLVPVLIFAALPLIGPILQAAQGEGEKLKQVSPQNVCMINKKHFDKPQTPVTVEGRTYYACCDMCKTQLTEDPTTRKDKDPVSGKEVDKATAAIGVDKEGHVYFFENADNLKKFRVPARTE
jgi:YHS domain-containing protein